MMTMHPLFWLVVVLVLLSANAAWITYSAHQPMMVCQPSRWRRQSPASLSIDRQLNLYETTSPSSSSSTIKKQELSPLDMDLQESLQEILDYGRQIGPVGVFSSKENQDRIMTMATALSNRASSNRQGQQHGEPPARIPLKGIHDLIYSASPGTSSGKIGPFFAGTVTQTFVDDTTFINAVSFGPLQFQLTASRQIKDDTTIEVFFQRFAINIGGMMVQDRAISGGGLWKYLYCGIIQHDRVDGQCKLVRIMQAPNLFVLTQTLPSLQSLDESTVVGL